MMEVTQALEILGVKRVIWIDDHFNETPAQLASLLTNSLETTQACEFPELLDALAMYEFDATAAVSEVTQILTDISLKRVEEIKAEFFAVEATQKDFPTSELSVDVITKACELLCVEKKDRWTFEKANQDLGQLCSDGDTDIGYIVDLNEAGGSPTRGLDVLRLLWDSKSAGTTFILTHDTTIPDEGKTETKVREDLLNPDGLGFPICVIAKERLYYTDKNIEAMKEALCTGVKRAGLRRSMHEVLDSAHETMCTAIDEAAHSLLSIPPEKLESHVFERGYKEGVSELHVVERAITAYLGKRAREFFGTDNQVHSSAKRLRALRAIPLETQETDPDPHLSAFREAEVWESDDLLNRALTPIACGDIFELDRDEDATKASSRKFVLLGQPCDISLRPEKQARVQDTAFLVSLRNKTNIKKDDPKAPLLPLTPLGEQCACDFRNATAVRLSILDLASFRSDGRVRVDHGHTPPAELLAGQQQVYADRAKTASAALADDNSQRSDGATAIELQLTFATSGDFKHIYMPIVEKASKVKAYGKIIKKPKRITWCLRRCGRVRMPYAAALLDQYTSVMSRHAFDLDFMSAGGADSEQHAAEPTPGLTIEAPTPEGA